MTSNVLESPRMRAVDGMNWDMPSAPLGLTTFALNRLSRQMSRAKNSGGRAFCAA